MQGLSTITKLVEGFSVVRPYNLQNISHNVRYGGNVPLLLKSTMTLIFIVRKNHVQIHDNKTLSDVLCCLINKTRLFDKLNTTYA